MLRRQRHEHHQFKEGRCTTLVLTRRVGEKIILNNEILITVVDIDRNKIRLGIEAPRSVNIARDEHRTPEEIEAIRAKIKGRSPATDTLATYWGPVA